MAMVKEAKSIRLFGTDIPTVPSIRLFGVDINTVPSIVPPSLPTLILVPPSVPSLSTQMAQAIQSGNGSNLLFLANKKLTISDVNRKQNRLYIPRCKRLLDLDFLTEDEKTMMRKDGGIKVIVVDPKGEQYKMTFKRWKNTPPILIDEWKDLVKNNQLKGGSDSIELWSFRVNSQLRFAVDVRFGSQSNGAGH